jgi:hypothetical protein
MCTAWSSSLSRRWLARVGSRVGGTISIRRPAIGIQFVDIPEFPDLGTQVSQDVSAAIAGKTSVSDALARGQTLAGDVAERYRSRQSS